MMEAMIPSQAGMSLRTLLKTEEAKEAQIKKGQRSLPKRKKEKMREKREGAMLLSFFHTCASK